MAGWCRWAVSRMRRRAKDIHAPQEWVVRKRKSGPAGRGRRRCQPKDRARRVSWTGRREWVRKDDLKQTAVTGCITRYRGDPLQRPRKAHRYSLAGWRCPKAV